MTKRCGFAFGALVLALLVCRGMSSVQAANSTAVVAITSYGNLLRAVTDDGRVFGSSSGTSWGEVGNIGSGSIVDMIEKGNYLYAISSSGSVYGSGSGGASWAFFGNVPAGIEPVEPSTWGQIKYDNHRHGGSNE